nr:MAG TPA: hypothetical protein [Caudoviricetes sp.]
MAHTFMTTPHAGQQITGKLDMPGEKPSPGVFLKNERSLANERH